MPGERDSSVNVVIVTQHSYWVYARKFLLRRQDKNLRWRGNCQLWLVRMTNWRWRIGRWFSSQPFIDHRILEIRCYHHFLWLWGSILVVGSKQNLIFVILEVVFHPCRTRTLDNTRSISPSSRSSKKRGRESVAVTCDHRSYLIYYQYYLLHSRFLS